MPAVSFRASNRVAAESGRDVEPGDMSGILLTPRRESAEGGLARLPQEEHLVILPQHVNAGVIDGASVEDMFGASSVWVFSAARSWEGRPERSNLYQHREVDHT